MIKENGTLKKHPRVKEIIDEFTSVYISKTPMRGNINEFKDLSPQNLICGVCGNKNIKLIHYTSGGTTDGTVEVQEVQCFDCNCFTMYYWSDRV